MIDPDTLPIGGGKEDESVDAGIDGCGQSPEHDLGTARQDGGQVHGMLVENSSVVPSVRDDRHDTIDVTVTSLRSHPSLDALDDARPG